MNANDRRGIGSSATRGDTSPRQVTYPTTKSAATVGGENNITGWRDRSTSRTSIGNGHGASGSGIWNIQCDRTVTIDYGRGRPAANVERKVLTGAAVVG